jgi:hypothetical protein
MVAKAKQVYADVNMDDFNKAEKIRELDWRSKQALAPADFAKVVKVVHDYNEFRADVVSRRLKREKDICVEFAREGSPAIYVHGPKAALERILKDAEKLAADKAKIRDGVLRLWWD